MIFLRPWLCVTLLVGARTLSAQSSSAEAAVRFPVTWAKGTGAPTVQTPVAAMLGIDVGFWKRGGAGFGIDARLSTSDINVKENSQKWDGGNLTVIDVVGTFSYRPLLTGARRLSLEAGAGVTFLSGARTVAPFHDTPKAIPVGEGAIAYDLPYRYAGSTIAIFVRTSINRVGGAHAGDAVSEPGYVRSMNFGGRITR